MQNSSAKLKILFLAESLNVGGAEKALVSLLRLIDYSQFDVTLKLICRSGDFLSDLSQIHDLNVDAFYIPSDNIFKETFNYIRLKSIYSWLPTKCVGNHLCRGYDVVIAFCEGYLTKWVAAATVKCKKIAWVHTDMVANDWPLKTRVFHSLAEEIHAYSKFNNIVGVSTLVSDGVRRKFASKNVSTIYNILDPDIYIKATESIEPLKRRRLNFIGVGRLEKVKGFDRLIETMNILVNGQHADIQLVIIGDGSCRHILEQLVKKYNLKDYIYLAGNKPNPYPYMKWADVFVCPSRQEGFNIAILEAMTLGKPIVSTDCVGPREILADGHYGIITENNVSALSNTIYEVYEGQKDINYFSKLSIQRSKNYNPNIQIESINNLILNLR